MTKLLSYWAVVVLALVTSCEDAPPLPPRQEIRSADTSYVQVFPSFGTFLGAQGLFLGRDELLYVADTRNNRVVMLNRAGQELSSRQMLHPISIGQNTRLDLYVGGEIVAANGDTVGALFVIRLYSPNPDSAHRLDIARLDTIWREPERPNRRFSGITVFDDNTFIVSRTAVPAPNNVSPIDPDARVLQFSSNNVFITPVPAFTSGEPSGGAGGITTIGKPTGLAYIPGTREFVLTQASFDTSLALQYGALWMRYERSPDFEGWLPKYDPANLIDRGVDFIRTFRYRGPSSVAIDPVRKDVFVADAALDSVFKFNSRGRFKAESFGFVRSGGVMTKPTGLAFFERVLYVLDANSGRILRYRLTTDIPR